MKVIACILAGLLHELKFTNDIKMTIDETKVHTLKEGLNKRVKELIGDRTSKELAVLLGITPNGVKKKLKKNSFTLYDLACLMVVNGFNDVWLRR